MSLKEEMNPLTTYIFQLLQGLCCVLVPASRVPLVSLREEKTTKLEMAGPITWAPQGEYSNMLVKLN